MHRLGARRRSAACCSCESLGNGSDVQDTVKLSSAWALLLAATTMVAKALIDLRTAGCGRRPGTRLDANGRLVRQPIPTVLIGVLGGLIVGMTSVGSGSLIIVAAAAALPAAEGRATWSAPTWCRPSRWSASAALGHILFGDFQLGLTSSLLIGALPGVYIGARVSAVAPGWMVRRALVFVLLASGLKLLDVPTATARLDPARHHRGRAVRVADLPRAGQRVRRRTHSDRSPEERPLEDAPATPA